MDNQPCAHCGPDKKYWRPDCPVCKGTGVIKGEVSSSTQLPAEVDIEELWDQHSILIGEDIDDLSYWSGRDAMKKEDFIKAIAPISYKLHFAQQEIESLTGQLKQHAQVSHGNMKLLKEENVKERTKLHAARALLEKVIYRHEGGLLPDRLLYKEIKTFLDGTK